MSIVDSVENVFHNRAKDKCLFFWVSCNHLKIYIEKNIKLVLRLDMGRRTFINIENMENQ